MSIKVLVTGAATPAGQSMLEALDSDSVELIGCDSETKPEFEPRIGAPLLRVHPSDHREFVGDLVTLCAQREVDVLVPMRASDQVAVMPVRGLFERLGALVWLAPIPPHATRSQARRIVSWYERSCARSNIAEWLRRLSGRGPGHELSA